MSEKKQRRQSRATLTAAPAFAYDIATRYMKARGAELDLSALRCAIIGGDAIRTDVLRRFGDVFRSSGLDEAALCPSYGLAEAGLGVAMTPPEARYRTRQLQAWRGAGAFDLVSSGPPLGGNRIEVREIELAADGFGELVVRTDEGAEIDTGDMGAIIDGWVYVVGRVDGEIVANGIRVSAGSVETAIRNALAPDAVETVVASSGVGRWAAVVVVSDERRRTAEAVRLIRGACLEVAGSAPDRVAIVSLSDAPRTSSGKVARGAIRTAIRIDGEDGQPRSFA